MNGSYCFCLEEQQICVNVRIFTQEKGGKNFCGISENARGKRLHQMFN